MGRDHLYRAEIHAHKTYLGNDGASWCVLPALITPESIVYSVGVGSDVSFDLQLIKQFGVVVHAFDPTPRSIRWVGSQTLPDRFIMHEFGMANHNGELLFSPPLHEEHVSYFASGPGPKTVQLPVRRLQSIMSELGHQSIDVLKLDIEGSEYDVIDDILNSGIIITQLLVEFHHRNPRIGIGKTREAVRRLRAAGYVTFDVSPSGEELGLFRLEHGRYLSSVIAGA
jgi:FkbM family methyltransferase